jgi:hypothetical protein
MENMNLNLIKTICVKYIIKNNNPFNTSFAKKIMEENNEWGYTYLCTGIKIAQVRKRGGINIEQVKNNLDEINPDWLIRIHYEDKKGNIYIKPGKGRKRCIELNYNNNAGGEFYSDLFEVIRELGSMDIKETKSICSELEKMAYEGMNSKKR